MLEQFLAVKQAIYFWQKLQNKYCQKICNKYWFPKTNIKHHLHLEVRNSFTRDFDSISDLNSLNLIIDNLIWHYKFNSLFIRLIYWDQKSPLHTFIRSFRVVFQPFESDLLSSSNNNNKGKRHQKGNLPSMIRFRSFSVVRSSASTRSSVKTDNSYYYLSCMSGQATVNYEGHDWRFAQMMRKKKRVLLNPLESVRVSSFSIRLHVSIQVFFFK